MKLMPSQQIVYAAYKRHGALCEREVDNLTHTRKSSMRVSEMNFAYQKSNGIDVPNLKDDTKNFIVKCGRNKSREVLKKIGTPLTKVAYDYIQQEDGSVREMPRLIEV